MLQFSWWAFHIITLAKKASNTDDFVYRKIMMIAGEASVFLIILFIGVYFVRKSFKKELELAQEKKNFILSVTHELKTPIASSKLFAETLLKRELPIEKQQDILQKINNDQERLQSLVENILFAAKMEEHSISLSKKEITLLPFIQRVIAELNLSANVQFNIPSELKIFIDEFYFTSVVRNLHENAVKYSDENSEIKWTAKINGPTIIIEISDLGDGIPQEDKKKIFELFYRLGDENIRTNKGTGIGLYLVKNIVKLHEGSISVKNNKPKGTIFELELPKL